MAAPDTTVSEELDSLYAILDGARRVEEARANLASSGESGSEPSADSARFQCYDSARTASVKASRRHCQLNDGSQRYADKPFTRERPRAISPELRAFYGELEMWILT